MLTENFTLLGLFNRMIYFSIKRLFTHHTIVINNRGQSETA